MGISKGNAKKISRTVLSLSTAGANYHFLTKPGMNSWLISAKQKEEAKTPKPKKI